jgi:hypothetical protein
MADTAPMISIVVDTALVLTRASSTASCWTVGGISVSGRIVVQILGHIVGNLSFGQFGYCGQG